MTRFELNILGCGSATSNLVHLPSCQVLNIRDNLFMIDCGEGAQHEMRRHSLKFSRLNHIFISHLHGDHCFGLPGLLSTMALLGKTGSVTVHTFDEGAKQFGEMMKFFLPDSPFELRFNVIKPKKDVIYEDDAITVTTFPLIHRIPAVGFIFREKEKFRHINGEMAKFHNVPAYKMQDLRRGEDFIKPDGTIVPNALLTTPADPSISYAYCSDTRYSRRVRNSIKGVTWVYHEATYGDECEAKAHARFHSTARQAGIVAREAEAQNLIIGHFSKRYTSSDALLAQAREEFTHVIAAHEGLRIDLNKNLSTILEF